MPFLSLLIHISNFAHLLALQFFVAIPGTPPPLLSIRDYRSTSCVCAVNSLCAKLRQFWETCHFHKTNSAFFIKYIYFSCFQKFCLSNWYWFRTILFLFDSFSGIFLCIWFMLYIYVKLIAFVICVCMLCSFCI